MAGKERTDINKTAVFQIYFNYGQGLSEANSLIIPYSPGSKVKIRKDHTLTGDLKEIRIDPSNNIGFFQGFSFKLIGNGKELLYLDGLPDKDKTQNILLTSQKGAFMSLTDDPMIWAEIAAPKGANIIIEANLEFTEVIEPFTSCISTLMNRSIMKDNIIKNYKITLEQKDEIIRRKEKDIKEKLC